MFQPAFKTEIFGLDAKTLKKMRNAISERFEREKVTKFHMRQNGMRLKCVELDLELDPNRARNLLDWLTVELNISFEFRLNLRRGFTRLKRHKTRCLSPAHTITSKANYYT